MTSELKLLLLLHQFDQGYDHVVARSFLTLGVAATIVAVHARRHTRRTTVGWASDELDTINLGDARLTKRAASLVEALAESPTASIPGACHDWAEARAAYRFFDREHVDLWGVLVPHIRSTEWRVGVHRLECSFQRSTPTAGTAPIRALRAATRPPAAACM